MITRVLPACLLVLMACGSTNPSLSRDERERLPQDGRQEIFDGENDLIIARNRADEARDRLAQVDAALEKLSPRQDRNEARLSHTPATANYGSHLRKVTRAERDYLDARREVALAEVEAARQEVAVARARLNLVKQRQLVRIGKEPLKSLPEYEQALTAAEGEAKAKHGSSLDLRTKAQSLLDAWKNAQAEYARTTNDYDSGIWLE